MLCRAHRADASVGFTSVLLASRLMLVLIVILAITAGRLRRLRVRHVASIVVYGYPGEDACVRVVRRAGIARIAGSNALSACRTRAPPVVCCVQCGVPTVTMLIKSSSGFAGSASKALILVGIVTVLRAMIVWFRL